MRPLSLLIAENSYSAIRTYVRMAPVTDDHLTNIFTSPFVKLSPLKITDR